MKIQVMDFLQASSPVAWKLRAKSNCCCQTLLGNTTPIIKTPHFGVLELFTMPLVVKAYDQSNMPQ